MKANTRFILLTCLLLCLSACTRKPDPQSLLIADSLTNVQPDSAITLLHIIKDSMDTDSKEDKRHLPQINCAGKQEDQDLENTTQVLEYFGKAIEASPEGTGYKVKRKIYNQMGTLILYQKTDNEALETSNKTQKEGNEHTIIIICLISLLSLALLFAYLQYAKRKNLQLKIQSEKPEEPKNEQYGKSVGAVEEKKQVEIELAKHEQAYNSILETEIYKHIQKQLSTTTGKKLLSSSDWKELELAINRTYSGFTEDLYSLYNLNEHEYRVCLLIKIKIAPIDIARLTAHSKEAISSTRRRLYKKVFHKNGTPKDWDDFIISL